MNIFRKLFGGKNTEDKSKSMSIPEAEKIMHSYSGYMQTDSPTPGCVADSSKLPYPKDKIKEALKIALTNVSDPKFRNALSTSYLHLANWQDGVGKSDVGFDISGLDPSGDINELLKSVTSAGDPKNSWQEMVDKELIELERELKTLI